MRLFYFIATVFSLSFYTQTLEAGNRLRDIEDCNKGIDFFRASKTESSVIYFISQEGKTPQLNLIHNNNIHKIPLNKTSPSYENQRDTELGQNHRAYYIKGMDQTFFFNTKNPENSHWAFGDQRQRAYISKATAQDHAKFPNGSQQELSAHKFYDYQSINGFQNENIRRLTHINNNWEEQKDRIQKTFAPYINLPTLSNTCLSSRVVTKNINLLYRCTDPKTRLVTEQALLAIRKLSSLSCQPIKQEENTSATDI